MPPFSSLSRGLGCVLILALGAGCTKESRIERALARGDAFHAEGRYDFAETEYRSVFALQATEPRATGRLGRLYFEQGRFVASYILLEKALAGEPENTEARLAFGRLARAVGKTVEGRNAARKVLETRPTDEEALLLLAQTSVTSRDGEETRRVVGELRERQGAAAGFHVALGALHLARREFPAAEAELRQALGLNPKSAAAHEVLGELLLARNETEAGREALRTAANLSPLRSPRRVQYIQALVQTDATDEARRELAALTTSAPDYIPALVVQMNLAYQERQYAEAGAAAGKILDRDGTNHDALSMRAAVRIAQGDIDGGIGALAMMENVYAQSPLVKFRLAHAYLRKGDQAAAEESLRKAIQLAPNYDEAILLQAELNVQKGNTPAAIQSLGQLLKRQPRLARAYIVLAQAYQNQGKFDECLGVLNTFTQRAPKSPEGHYFTALVLDRIGRKDEARQACERALALAADYWPAIELLANEDLVAGRAAAAAARIEQVVAAHPRQPTVWLLRAKVRLHQKDLAGAQADAKRAIEIDVNDSRGYLLLAKILLQSQQLAPAAETLAQVAAKSPAPEIYVQLGLVHDLLGQRDEARGAYEKALGLEAKFVPALNNLAVLLSAVPGQLERAVSLAARARELAPQDPHVLDTLGRALHLKGQPEAALPHLRASAEKLPASPEVQFHLGLCLYQLGQEQPARHAFLRVVETGPSPAILAEARDRLALLDLDIARDGAQRDVEARLQRTPNDPVALVRLGAIEARAGAHESAARRYEAVLKINPRDVRTHLALVELHAGPVSKPERVRELSRQALALAPHDGELAWKLGRIAYAQGDFAWAASTLREAGRILHDRPDVLLDHALAAFTMGRIDEAERAVQDGLALEGPAPRREEARRLAAMLAAGRSPAAAAAAQADAAALLAKEPDYAPALMVVGLGQEQKADFRGAHQTYEKIVARFPSFMPALRRQVILLAEHLGDDRKAEEIAQKVRAVFPDDPELGYALGAVHYRKGNYTEAVRLLRQSARQRVDHAETHFYLGLALHQQKNAAESRSSLQRALQLKLGAQESAEARRVLDQIGRGGAPR